MTVLYGREICKFFTNEQAANVDVSKQSVVIRFDIATIGFFALARNLLPITVLSPIAHCTVIRHFFNDFPS
jgi:hypothetical protein